MFYKILVHLVLILIFIFKLTFPQCSDNRTTSDYKAVCRINTTIGYATGFILSDGRIATAGHVAITLGAQSTIEFTIPPSTTANANDIYQINNGSKIYQYYNPSIEGEDWAVFSVYPNSITGKMPIEAQNSFLIVEQNNSFQDMYIIAYVNNDVQRKSVGHNSNSSGEVIRFDAYATSGNSGAPLINTADGKAVGIFTNLHCNPNGYNTGTSFFNSSLWAETNTNLTADNNIISPDNSHGLITVDNDSKAAPITFSKNKGELVTLQTNRQNDINNNTQDWNNISPNNQSLWLRTKPGFSSFNKGPNNPLAFSLTPDDYNSTYTANLRKRFQITHTCITEFNGLEYVPSGEIFEGNVGVISGNWNPYIVPLEFAGWIDDMNAPVLRTINPTANTNYSSLNKAINHSNSPTGFQSNSQRKVVRTPDGTIHLVYESMGHVWYEISTNNGTSWNINNNGHPLDSGAGKLPSIDYYGNMIAIVLQQQNGNNYNIKAQVYYSYAGNYILGFDITIHSEVYDPYSVNANPNISWGYDGKFVVTFERNQNGEFPSMNGINYISGSMAYNNITINHTGLLTGTDHTSINSTISTNKEYEYPAKFHVGWEQNNSIKYCFLTIDGNNTITSSSVDVPSIGNTYSYNNNPQIAVNYLGDAYLTWIGTNNPGNGSSKVVNRGKNGSNWSSTFNYYGNNVASPTLHFVNGSGQYIIAWSEGNGNSNKYCRSDFLNGILDYGILGRSIQVINGDSLDAIYSISFNNISLPYYFQMTHNSIIPKTLILTALIQGFYNGSTMVSDTVTVELHSAIYRYGLLESQKGVLSSIGIGTFNFVTVVNDVPYYIVIKHRNSIETWSATSHKFSSGVLSYDFTTESTQAYGNNLIMVGSKWCLYSGDVNQDGAIDAFDDSAVDNDNLSGGTPGIPSGCATDVNGDGGTDAFDQSIVSNNNALQVYRIDPGSDRMNPTNYQFKLVNKNNL